MTRLDALSPKEIRKLYIRSAYLYQPGLLLIACGVVNLLAALVSAFYGFSGDTDDFFLSLVFLLSTLWPLASAYVFICVRSSAARWFFKSWSMIGIVSVALTVFRFLLAVGSAINSELLVISLLALLVPLFIFIEILRSAMTDTLFGAEGFSHKQIVFALKTGKRGETFTDEDLPVAPVHRGFEKVCVIISWIGLGLAVACFLFNLYV